jgi:hypothetical protein
VAAALEELGIPYVLGGSLASAIHGEPRSTHDVDFVVDLIEAQVPELVTRLQGDYFVDEASIRAALLHRASFQLVHERDYTRVDVFIQPQADFDREKLERRVRITVDPASGAALWVTSAEDIVLQKLVWYRKGDEVSDRQWRDVLSVLRTNRGLDRTYLETWAVSLGVADLLSRALDEVDG